MSVSPDSFLPRKRRPSAGAFVPPNFSDHKLIQYLLFLSQQISSLQPLRVLLKKSSASIIRKSRLISVVFEELVRNPVHVLPPSAALCFEELYIVLQRIKVLLEDCSACSKTWLLLEIPPVSTSFDRLRAELSALLDVFPANELNVSEEVEELLDLIKKQCSENAAEDEREEVLRRDVVKMLDEIRRRIVPDHKKLSRIFERLNLCDAASCSDEIEKLEDEVENQNDDDQSKAAVIALIGLVRYGKCVLHGGSSPGTTTRRLRTEAEANFPADFRCPISLDLMGDPVVVSTGQTYDRSSISPWIESGRATCPKTGQPLAHTRLIPNLALKNLIALWCREQRIPFESTQVNVRANGGVVNKTAFEATRMTVSFLVKKLTVASQTSDAVNQVVHELRLLAKTDSDSRACIVEAGALPLLVEFLGSENSSLQVNAVTTILNLSIFDANRAMIMETDGVRNGLIEVLRAGATWEAKGNAAAVIFNLTGVHAYRKRIGRKTRVVKALLDLARSGPTNPKRDAMMAILNLAGDREAVARLIEGGVVDIVGHAMESMVDEAVAVLEVVVRRGGLAAVAAAYQRSMVKRLTAVLRDGSSGARESAAATLVAMCRKGGSEVVVELAAILGVERVIWEVMGMGTGRAKRKAATLLRILRRWAAGLIDEHVHYHSTRAVDMSSRRIVLPA